MVAAEGAGVIVYLRGHEGRGIGLGHKLRAYALQERGHDTVDANTALGLPVDSRDYGIGAAILVGLGVHRLRLITNNPHKYGGLSGYDLDLVGRVRTPAAVTAHNIAYLRTKRTGWATISTNRCSSRERPEGRYACWFGRAPSSACWFGWAPSGATPR